MSPSLMDSVRRTPALMHGEPGANSHERSSGRVEMPLSRIGRMNRGPWGALLSWSRMRQVLSPTAVSLSMAE